MATTANVSPARAGVPELGEANVLGRLEQRRHEPVAAPVVRVPRGERGQQHGLGRGQHRDADRFPRPSAASTRDEQPTNNGGMGGTRPSTHLPIQTAIRPSPR